MKFEFDVSELHRLAGDLATEAAVASGRMEKIIEEATERLYVKAASSAPVRTGALKASISRDQSRLARRVYSPLRQGFFQEFGTSKHPPQAWLLVHAEEAQRQLAADVQRAKWGW